MIGMKLVDEPRRLLAVDAFGELTMKERIVHVHLVHWPVTRGGDGEDSADGSRLDHGRERLIKIHTRPLREPADDPTRLVAI